MERPVTVFLGLGANTGDCEAQVRGALERLAAVPGIEVADVSPLRWTEPVDAPPPRFLNGAARLETAWAPAALLTLCKELERAAGRDPDAPRNHPRPLDLDLLLYGDEEIDTRELRVPHPRIGERAFVLEALADLGLAVEDVLARLPQRPALEHETERFAARCTQWLQGGCSLGLVPTMGALHAGHASLLQAARAECDRVAATVFVNPLQFGPAEDFERYPRTLAEDFEVVRAAGADALFAPSAAAMYPEGFCTRLSVGAEARDLEGAARPGHFEGVVTVVAKLLAIARPTSLYLGQKDAQQVAVLRRMVLDLGFPTRVRECPTRREADGLALSSRNVYLEGASRSAAAALWRALAAARERWQRGERDARALRQAALAVLEAEPEVSVEYLEIRREGDLAPWSDAAGGARMLVAARVGGTRLIDNVSLDAAPNGP